MPNGFIITLPPGIAIVDPAGLKFRPLNEDDFSIVFHEYVHYLQNIATPSGFHSFKCAFDIWRLFRETVNEDGISAGSSALSPSKQQWLDQYLDLIFGIEGQADPKWPEGFDPDVIEIDHVAMREEQRHLGPIVTLVTEIIIEGRALESDNGRSETYSYHFGATAISEGIAFELDQIVASGPNARKMPANDAPLLPYHMLRNLAETRCPGIPILSVLSLGCLSLLWNDPAGELMHLFEMYNDATQAGASPGQAIERILLARTPDIEGLITGILQSDIPDFENELRNLGTFERGLQQILDRFRTLLTRRLAEPLLELSVIHSDGGIDFARTRHLMESIPVCTVIQENDGGDDDIGRDILLTSSSLLNAAHEDDELALLYTAFDYSSIHQSGVGFEPTAQIDDYRCPFYSCCTFEMRRAASENCRTKPWTSATWPGWPAGTTCWYGAAAKRRPNGAVLI